jgi:hypothetical protein
MLSTIAVDDCLSIGHKTNRIGNYECRDCSRVTIVTVMNVK